MSVRIKFLGGVQTVTGSSHLVSTRFSDILIDCGLFYGRRDEFYELNSSFKYNPRELDAVLLSHAHIDHCGNLPNLIKRGLHCKIYTTSATKDLCSLMLADSGKVQEEDVRYLNKINRRLGQRQRMRRPLYTEKEGRHSLRKFRALSYRQRFKVTKDVTCTFYDAAHILGSSIIVLDINSDRNNNMRIGYAVDLGRKGLPLLNEPTIIEGMDYLILESTYGGRVHSPIAEAKNKLKDAINRTIERSGKVIIPSFALERAQEVIYFLNELIKEKQIPPIPIYVDSPLATNITDVFRTHYGYLDNETRMAMKSKKEGPFDFVNLNYIADRNDSKSLNNDKRPMIIIAGSGMCEAGRILHHLKNNITESKNTVLVVGYMAENTLGKKIVERQRYVRIYGVEYELNAEVVVINAFSGHADKNELCEYVKSCLPIKKVFIVHGEKEQSENIAGLLSQSGINTHIPEKYEEAVLT
ncbi:MAG: MBL fold metallo-hydrolase [Candidatus Omnitrophica bacterium]|nr:MBL fold metallo-hydrolase [Candidatus Omnitrophota bacterium]MDD5352005.1 MBL fold metallo-hydrolase [Candidatus Omnitrophota bacterium]MDD5551059.1 MBL fold metallo-hydrolase [Candidatus Omnitrophota bacterium]